MLRVVSRKEFVEGLEDYSMRSYAEEAHKSNLACAFLVDDDTNNTSVYKMWNGDNGFLLTLFALSDANKAKYRILLNDGDDMYWSKDTDYTEEFSQILKGLDNSFGNMTTYINVGLKSW